MALGKYEPEYEPTSAAYTRWRASCVIGELGPRALVRNYRIARSTGK
jgi:hypothetical protein